MITDVSAEEARFYDDGSLESLAAYGAALRDAGDPLGQLIQLEMALEVPFDPFKHKEIASLRHKLRRKRNAVETWENGMLVSCKMDDRRKEGNLWIGPLMNTRVGRGVREITFTHSTKSHNFKGTLTEMVKVQTPNLRVLRVDTPASSGFGGLMGLHESAPRLEGLYLRGKVDTGTLKALNHSWPMLQTLNVDFELTPVWKKKPQNGKKLGALFVQGVMPELKRLRLERTGMDDSLLQHLQTSGLLPQLERLQLGGFFSKEAVEALMAQVPPSCMCVISRYQPHADHQEVVEVHHIEPSSEQKDDYAKLWEPLEEVAWWDEGTFAGTTLDQQLMVRCSRLADGTLHGRLTRSFGPNRIDEMYWYGVQHGNTVTFFAKAQSKAPDRKRYINGLRDQTIETLNDAGEVLKRWTMSQGVVVEDLDMESSPEVLKERLFRKRFGVDFSFDENEWYTLGAPKELDDALSAIPQIANGVSKSDDGAKVRAMQLKDGTEAQAVLWYAGDTLCGVLVEKGRALATIEDGFIAPCS